MRLCNSYIFIPNPYKKKDTPKKKSDGGVYLDLTDNFVSYFTNLFPNLQKEQPDIYAFTLKYFSIIELNSDKLDVEFFIHEVADTYFLDVTISNKSKTAIIRGLEYIQSIIEKTISSTSYIEIISYDAVSEFYCNKAYRKLNELERNLRKLLFNIYIVNVGWAYYDTTISEEIKNKAQAVIKAKGSDESKEIERMQKFFYSLEFIDVQQMLFIPRWTEIDAKEKSIFLEKHKDLSKLSDNELRIAFNKVEPKSDWERFFSDKLDADTIRSLIEQIRISRNNVAHCKFFYREEYATCCRAIGKFNKEIESAIHITESKDFIDKNNQTIKGILDNLTTAIIMYNESRRILTQYEVLHCASATTDVVKLKEDLNLFEKELQALIKDWFIVEYRKTPDDVALDIVNDLRDENDERSRVNEDGL